MIQLKTIEELRLMKESAHLVSKTLGMLAKEIKPGINTLYLDKLAHDFIKDHGAEPAFLGYGGFPNSLCISPNDQVVHGFPNKDIVKEGDVLSVDCGVILNGFVGDHAYTFVLGESTPEVLDLVRITKESLYEGIKHAITGKRTGDIGHAIESYTNGQHGYGVIRDFVGHGVGREMHEDPQIPNYGKQGKGKKLMENMVLAIEPMITMGTHKIYMLDDGWTVVSADQSPAVHFEHNVCVKKGAPLILSDFSIIEAAEKANSNLNSSYY